METDTANTENSQATCCGATEPSVERIMGGGCGSPQATSRADKRREQAKQQEEGEGGDHELFVEKQTEEVRALCGEEQPVSGWDRTGDEEGRAGDGVSSIGDKTMQDVADWMERSKERKEVEEEVEGWRKEEQWEVKGEEEEQEEAEGAGEEQEEVDGAEEELWEAEEEAEEEEEAEGEQEQAKKCDIEEIFLAGSTSKRNKHPELTDRALIEHMRRAKKERKKTKLREVAPTVWDRKGNLRREFEYLM